MRFTAALTVLLTAAAVYAGDQPEHRQMVYGLALAAGYSPGEAKVVADGSWSMDTNDSTTAYRSLRQDGPVALAVCSQVTRDPRYGARLLTEDKALDQVIFAPGAPLARVGASAFNHALMTDPRTRGHDRNQPGMDAVFREYIRNQTAKLKSAGLGADDVKRTQLLLVGQYLHQLVDSHVHPRDPLYGHAQQTHTPDYAYANVEAFTQAAFKTLATLKILRAEVPQGNERGRPLPLTTTTEQLDFCKHLVGAVADGYDTRRKLLPLGGVTEVTSREEIKINEKVGAFLAKAYGSPERMQIPRFDKATYQIEGERFTLIYEGKKAHIDNVVPWVLHNPRYQDLAKSVRTTMRQHIATWSALDQALRDVGARLTGEGEPRYVGPADLDMAKRLLEKLRGVDNVDLDIALVFLAEIGVPGVPRLPAPGEADSAAADGRAAKQQKARWQALLAAAAAQIRANAPAFYRSHQGECTIRGAVRKDGTFDYVYRPSVDWIRHRKEEERRLAQACATVETTVQLLEGWTALLEASLAGAAGKCSAAWDTRLQQLRDQRARYTAVLDELRKQ